MAVDATGTATSPDAIPTYNTAADAPSGKGFNNAIAAIQTALSARASKPSGILSGEVPVWNGSAFVRSSVTNIGATSLGSGTPDATKFLRGDSSWQVPTSAAATATVATTIAGLGAGVDGKIGYLRVGSGQFRLLTMIYDGSLTKWISQERLAGVSISPNGATSVTSATMYPQYGTSLHKWADYIAAGLHPQYRVFGATVATSTVATWTIGWTFAHMSLDNYPTSTPNDLTRVAPDIVVGNPGASGASTTLYTGGENGTLDWVDCPTPGSPKALGGAVFYCQGAATTGGWSLNLWERWVG